jgi:hypothetical protein
MGINSAPNPRPIMAMLKVLSLMDGGKVESQKRKVKASF